MRALLLPIKDLSQAKQRLAPFLRPEERFGLAQAMLADTIRAVRGVRQADKIFVVTNYAPAMQAAKVNGWELLREDRQISESFSVDYASIQCAKRGVTALLRLPLTPSSARRSVSVLRAASSSLRMRSSWNSRSARTRNRTGWSRRDDVRVHESTSVCES